MHSTPTPPDYGNLKNRKVLLVEDERVNAFMVTAILQREEVVVILASSGEEALELAGSEDPDLVLLDLLLPGIDGLETCRRLQEMGAGVAPPVIFITAETEPQVVAACFTAGAADYLAKPIRAEEMLVRIRTQLKLRTLLEAQESIIRELTEANRAKNQFLGIAAHDLRNPLVSIGGFADLLLDDLKEKMDEGQREMLQCVAEASQSMLRLINDLLDISRIESGDLRLQVTENDLSDLVRRSVLMNEATARRKDISIELRVAAPVVFPFDRERLRQVIDNLLSNAIKFSPPGSRVAVLLEQKPENVRLRIQDEGPGIPDAERPKLFTSFGKTSVRPTGAEESTGLGLAICHRIISAHQGMISHHNLPGKGSEFSLSLYRQASPNPAP